MEILEEDQLKIRHICANWHQQDIANLARILDLSSKHESLAHIEDKIKWLFHSKILAQGKVAAIGIWAKINRRAANLDIENQFDTPTYEQLVSGLLKTMKISHADASLGEKEEFLCDAVIAEALVNMSPEQRRRAFTTKAGLDEFTDNLESNDNTFSQAAKGFGAFSLVNAVGFSLYTSSTMALSFVSGAAGITLPFAVYSSMTGFISVIVGPPGWAAFGSYVAWKLTSADWDKLRLALIYIITVRSRDLEKPAAYFFEDNR
jgi:hypothetical protein